MHDLGFPPKKKSEFKVMKYVLSLKVVNISLLNLKLTEV
jgi:hypothetical protein